MLTQAINEYENLSRNYISFPQRDEKGRRCGVVVSRWMADVIPSDEKDYGYTDLPVGRYYRVVVMPTRNNNPYGASQSSPFFKSDAEARVYINRRVRETERRYAKKYGS